MKVHLIIQASVQPTQTQIKEGSLFPQQPISQDQTVGIYEFKSRGDVQEKAFT
jgi:hypothetical protein